MNTDDKLQFAEEILKSIIDNVSEQVIDDCVMIPVSCISDISYYFNKENWSKIMAIKKYFVHDYEGDGFMFYETEQEAIEAFKRLVNDYKAEGWVDDVSLLFCGEIKSKAIIVDNEIRAE